MYNYLLGHYRFWSYRGGDVTLTWAKWAIGVELSEFGICLLIGPLELLIYWPKLWGATL